MPPKTNSKSICVAVSYYTCIYLRGVKVAYVGIYNSYISERFWRYCRRCTGGGRSNCYRRLDVKEAFKRELPKSRPWGGQGYYFIYLFGGVLLLRRTAPRASLETPPIWSVAYRPGRLRGSQVTTRQRSLSSPSTSVIYLAGKTLRVKFDYWIHVYVYVYKLSYLGKINDWVFFFYLVCATIMLALTFNHFDYKQ